MKQYFIQLFLLSLILFSSAQAYEPTKVSFHFEEITYVDKQGIHNHSSHLLLKLVPENYPINKLLELRVSRPGPWNHFEVYNLLIKEDGDVYSVNYRAFFKEETPFILAICSPLLGETIDFSLHVNGNPYISSDLFFTPYPIEITDEQGRKVILKLIDYEKRTFYYEGTGFKDWENIQVKISGTNNDKKFFERSLDGKIKGYLDLKSQDNYGFVRVEFITENSYDLWFDVPMELNNKDLWYWGKWKFNDDIFGEEIQEDDEENYPDDEYYDEDYYIDEDYYKED